MDYQEFRKKIIAKLEELAEADEIVRDHATQKNNGVVWYGVSVSEKKSTMAKVIYLETSYERFQEGECAEDLAMEILDACRDRTGEVVPDLSLLQDLAYLRDALHIQLVEAEGNEQLLQSVPHRPFLDLEMICRCEIPVCEEKGSMLVRYEHLEMMHIREEELWEYAMAPKERTQPVMVPIHQMIGSMLETIDYDPPGDERNWIYVLTTKSICCGASCITNPEFLRSVAQIYERDFYILPSSIHECISVPVSGRADTEEMKVLLEMVTDVNNTEVLETEILAYSVYRYYAKTGELKVCGHFDRSQEN